MARKKQADPEIAVEQATLEFGRQLFAQLKRRSPSIFERRWWDDRILSWAMSDESVKVQMFRFIDVLPMLRSRESITRHLQEYFDEVRTRFPKAVRLALDVSQPDSLLGRALAFGARSNARRMAQRFIAGTTVEEVLATVSKLRRQGFAFTMDLLGEAVISEYEADAYQHAYLNLIAGLAPAVNCWQENSQLDSDDFGSVPRINVSLKLSALYSQFKPIDPGGTSDGVKQRLRPILRAAREYQAYVHIDMEHYAYKDATLEIFKQVLMEPEFRDYADVGIVIQAYLPDAERDLAELLKWSKKRKTPVWVRLVKGAYWDFETVFAKAANWPIPVFQQKWQSDACFERCTRLLMENYRHLRPAFGSHNLRSLSYAIAWAKHLGVPDRAFEIQMLYGMGGEPARLFAEQGYRVRAYTPFGEMIPGMAYLVRRLLENTSNDSFLRASFAEDVSVETLLMKPDDVGAAAPPIEEEPAPEFSNEPLTDFSRAESREAMSQALEDVAAQLGEDYALVIDGRHVQTRENIISRNPADPAQVIGKVSSASEDDAIAAVEAARKAFPHWAGTEAHYRAEYVELIAEKMSQRRFELAAWMVFECGKPWKEADADVAEAIDFCRYYAARMRELSEPKQCDVPGEENTLFYKPRGVAVVIAPWNFPLAILTGMTAAALVAGNTVIMKPAEQSSVIAAKLMEIIEDVAIPRGVVGFLPGVGEEVGPELVGNPDIDLIAFTGSQAVGLAINEQAAATDERQLSVKRVIAEMGGKNAIIVDEDADLDEAVVGVMHSAFGYSGQKCSACSRAIVHEAAYDDFLQRLIGATESLKIGAPQEPGTSVGPVIDEEAQKRILATIAEAREEGIELALQCELGEAAGNGYFVPPTIFCDVDPESSLAQEEIFGPVLAVMKANDLEEALKIANGTRYALTGGVYSRSPENLKRVKQRFDVGNLYLNREITGALVNRQPFGGFRMSGIGSKTGGPDYLLQFLLPVNITENTMRRGFAPEPDPEG